MFDSIATFSNSDSIVSLSSLMSNSLRSFNFPICIHCFFMGSFWVCIFVAAD